MLRGLQRDLLRLEVRCLRSGMRNAFVPTGLHASAVSSRRTLSSMSGQLVNPLLDIDVPMVKGSSTSPISAPGLSERECSYKDKDLAVSPKKLRVVSKLAIGLYWREANAQLEFCRKNIAIFLKNGISRAARKAEEEQGLDPTRLIVSQLAVSKAPYRKEIDIKGRGRMGIRRHYASHIHVVLKEVSAEDIARTRFYDRWVRSTALLAMPWEERVAALPRYKPIPGYVPGEARIQPLLALAPEEATPKRRKRRPRSSWREFDGAWGETGFRMKIRAHAKNERKWHGSKPR